MDDRTCDSYRQQLWDFAAGTLPRREQVAVAGHLRGCRQCQMERQDVETMRTGLRALPKRTPPPILTTRLQVISSRERSRLLLRQSIAIRWKEIRSRVKLTFDNLLKPLAVPATGGLLASFLCFGVIVDSLHLDPPFGVDIPVGIYTAVTLDAPSPFFTRGKDVMVELTVDETGNVRDFTALPQGKVSPDEMQEIGNLVLYSTFRPATRFGHPVTSKILVNIQHVHVRG